MLCSNSRESTLLLEDRSTVKCRILIYCLYEACGNVTLEVDQAHFDNKYFMDVVSNHWEQ